MVAGFIIGIIIGLVICWAAAEEFCKIAEMKGYPERKYFWWSFLIPPFGMLMVVALPDRRIGAAPAAQQTQPDDQLPAL